MAKTMFDGFRALLSGNVLWRSNVIDCDFSGRFEIIVKQAGGERLLVFKHKVGAGQYEYQVLHPATACELGEALIEGARRAGHAPFAANGV